MKFPMLFGLLFISLISTQSAQANQTLELKELPPLKPLHYCQNSAGEVEAQADECEAGKTEVSSISTIRNGKVIHAPLGETLETWNPDAKATTSAVSAPDTYASTPSTVPQSTDPKSLRLQILFFFFVSTIVSVISAMRGRSGVLTFLVCVLGGGLLNAIITAAGTGVGGTAAMVGLFAVPAVMVLRALSSNSD